MRSKDGDDPPAYGTTTRPTASDSDEQDGDPPAYENALPTYAAAVPGSASVLTAALAAAKTTEKKAPPVDDITAAFSSLHLANEPVGLPTPPTCLAHLKLLYAFRGLREEMGYMDGLWGIRDPDHNSKAPEVAPEVMSRLREKRWAIYLARAVDRYEAWWRALGGRDLTMADMERAGSAAYEMFPSGGPGDAMVWDETMLMPLDVLMVWHTHMLNPRAYLEDCIRFGHRALWLGGIPWATVNSALDASFTYTVPEEAKARWETTTGMAWENTACPMTKVVACPSCSASIEVPWTTWNPDDISRPTDDDFMGFGYGDGEFFAHCSTPDCPCLILKEALYAAKFVNDVKKLFLEDVPMPGTVLSLPKGMPIVGEVKPNVYEEKGREHIFPNHLLRSQRRASFLDIFAQDMAVTLDTVRGVIEATIMELAPLSDLANLALRRHSKMAIRKMMSRYEGNRCILALDLVAAVSRQAVFIDKMFKLDWLHSPAATPTMSRLITKYTRFIDIIARYPTEGAVPTLDVDLAWHTAQLSPSTYLLYTVDCCNKFVDHDDKVAAMVLRDSFEKTSKKYQKMYGEVYSECTCWYCETMRATHASSISGTFGLSSQDRVADAFHSSGAAKLCPPENSAHISAHSAVKVTVTARAQARHRARLDLEFERAYKRAEKRGRKIKTSKEYYNHWGTTYFMYGPWVAPSHFYPGLYDGGCPAEVEKSGCVDKTCAAGLGSGVCGGPGGCGSCGTDGGGRRGPAGGGAGGSAGARCGSGCGGGGCGGG